MNFDLSDDERALQQGMRDVCKRLFPMDRVRALEDAGGVDRTLWHELGQAGVFSLRIPESDGGVGLGMTEAALVFEELGRALVPGPVISTHLAASLLEGARSGERVVGMIERDRTPPVVGQLPALDTLAVVDAKGLWLLDPQHLGAIPVRQPLDPLTPVYLIEHLPKGERFAPPSEVKRWRREGAVLSAAMLVGIASACTEAAVAYAKERKQFGRVIGSFQAVKHICADMLVREEVARNGLYAAAVMCDDPSAGDTDRAVAGARLLAGEAALANGKASIQVHGGMGYTWEVDAHLYLKRAVLMSTRFGRSDDLAEAVASCLA
ncbi:MAG: acyl-CoA dehydrogenase family protein, partial [Actinomycetota bacterium]